MEIHRSPTSATGGLTAEERSALGLHHRRWVERSERTTPVEPEKIVPAINALYRAGGLQEPRVVLVPSPGVMAFAGTFASFIWEKRVSDSGYLSRIFAAVSSELDAVSKGLAQAVLQATASAVSVHDHKANGPSDTPSDLVKLTREATFDGADAATANAQDRSTIAEIQESFDVTPLVDMNFAIRDAMRDDFGNPVLTELLSSAVNDWGLSLASEILGASGDAESVTQRVADWWVHCQSSNAWTYQDYQITAGRDVLGLKLPEYAEYAYWEACTIHGGYRYLHAKFCLVCDFPSEIVDKNSTTISPGTGQRRYRWRDGWVV